MEKYINRENYSNFAYVNEKALSGEIKGVVVRFHGLGGQDMFFEDTYEGKLFGERGILYVVPYQNPWAWMNKQNVDYTDEIVDALFEKYSLSESTPIVSCGDSMGGQSCLVYAAYSKRTPISCAANCPVCDVVFHFTERVDLPRTLYSSLYNFDGTLEEGLRSISPIHIADGMPRIKYHIYHCDRDTAVNIDSHSEKLVKFFRENGYDVETYIQIYNCMGFLMQVEVEAVNSIIRNAKKPVMTIKSMAAGRTTPFVGLNFNWATIRDCDMVTVGCFSEAEAEEDIEISFAALERRAPEIAGRASPAQNQAVLNK